MRAPKARGLVAAGAVLAASLASPVRAQERLESWAAAGLETVLPLGPRSMCIDLRLRGAPSGSYRLDVFDASGEAQHPTTSGIGRVAARVCAHSSRALYAVVLPSVDGSLSIDLVPLVSETAEPPATDPDAPRAELGPGASFSASRRLAARIERARELGLHPSSRAFDVPVDASATFEVRPPAEHACAELLIDVDEGRLELEGLSESEPRSGLRWVACRGEVLRGRVLDGTPRARAVWLVPDVPSPTRSSTHESFLLDAALGARGMEPRILGNVIPGGSSVPVPIRLAAAGCVAVAALARAPVELTLTDDSGVLLARSVGDDPVPLLWHCAGAAGTTVAWVRSPVADATIRLVLATEVQR